MQKVTPQTFYKQKKANTYIPVYIDQRAFSFVGVLLYTVKIAKRNSRKRVWSIARVYIPFANVKEKKRQKTNSHSQSHSYIAFSVRGISAKPIRIRRTRIHTNTYMYMRLTPMKNHGACFVVSCEDANYYLQSAEPAQARKQIGRNHSRFYCFWCVYSWCNFYCSHIRTRWAVTIFYGIYVLKIIKIIIMIREKFQIVKVRL